jgi:hypothetical protein
MDIHKPKPWHGVREFLKEFGVIVLGVLVALGAEQSVEWLHRQAEVRDAREALRAEIADDMMWAETSQRRAICGRRYLRKYVRWAEGGPPPPVEEQAGFSRLLELNSANWDVVKAGPVAAMPLQERLAFAKFYAEVADYNTMAERERGAGIRMAEHYGLKRLSAAEADSLAKAISAYDSIEKVMIGMANGIRIRGGRTGATTAPIPPQFTAELDAVCRVAGAD